MTMKRCLSLILALILCFSLPFSVYASEYENTTVKNKIELQNRVNASKYAESFVKTIYDDNIYEAGKVITIYDETDLISGYCVDIISNKTNYGYVIIKFTNNKAVVSEFCIEPNAINPYDFLVEKHKIFDDDIKCYSFSPNDYQIINIEKSLIYDTELDVRKKIDIKEYKKSISFQKSNYYANSVERDTNYASLDGWTVISDSYSGSVKSNDTITNAYYLTYTTQRDIENLDGPFACSVVALCNLMRYYRMMGFYKITGDLAELYTILWIYAGTSDDGFTKDGNEVIAAKKYLQNLGYKCTTNSFLLDTYSNFKNAIDSDKPCILTYGAKFGNTNGGHAVLVMGYVETTSYKYLQVADGWNSYLRYLNFNGYNYTRLNGWSVTASGK